MLINKLKHSYKAKIYILLVSTISFFANYYFGKIGLNPIDSLAFFDSSFMILQGKLPIRDFWAFSGIFIDFFQSFFFKIFGVSWRAYLIHASFINFIVTLSFFFYLSEKKIDLNLALIVSLSFSFLFYPVSGTPFSYQHSLAFSYLSVLFLLIGFEKKSRIFFFFIPLFFLFGFFSNQVPSAYISIIVVLFLIINYVIFKRTIFLLPFVLGTILSFLVVIFFLYLINFDFINFFTQSIIFPLTIAKGRIEGSEYAYFKLYEKLSFKDLVLDFKFIHFFLVFIIFVLFLNNKKKILPQINSYEVSVLFLLLFISFFFIYHQLLTANQIFIFSIIPFLAGITLAIIKEKKFLLKNFLLFFFWFFFLVSTSKYFFRYNIERYFLDLQKHNVNIAIDANEIDNSLSGLKWLTMIYPKNPGKEISFIKEALELIRQDQRSLMVITHYSFFSSLTSRDIFIPNRWYFGISTYPTKNHKNFNYYKNFLGKKFIERKIQAIYIIDKAGKDMFSFTDFLDSACFNEKRINELVLVFEFKNCNS